MSDSIGEKIRVARKDAHLTQIQLAERMGVTKQTVSLYENGGVNPTAKMLAKFAAGLKVPVGLLAGDEEGQLAGQWVSIKTRLPESDKEDDIFVPCLVNVITWDLECSPFYPDESYGEYVSPAMYDTEQKIFSVGWDGGVTTMNALLDPENTDGRSGSRVTHWMELPVAFGFWEAPR